MSDITMCKWDNCPVKEICYRYKAKADEYQSYFLETPKQEENKECEYFWEINK